MLVSFLRPSVESTKRITATLGACSDSPHNQRTIGGKKIRATNQLGQGQGIEKIGY